MNKKTYTLNIVLAVIMGLACLIALLVRAFAPAVIIPPLNIPNIVLISLAAILVSHYLDPTVRVHYFPTAWLAVMTFFLLPLAAGFGPNVALGLVGGTVFTVVTFLFHSIQDRLSSGPAAKAAPLLSALGLYLAFQCLTGIIL